MQRLAPPLCAGVRLGRLRLLARSGRLGTEAIGLRLFLQQQLASLALMNELSLCLAQPIA